MRIIKLYFTLIIQISTHHESILQLALTALSAEIPRPRLTSTYIERLNNC